MQPTLRRAVFAGSWYPARASECEAEIRGFIEKSRISPPSNPNPVGGILPHAGWYFSGAIACHVIHCLKKAGPPAPDLIDEAGDRLKDADVLVFKDRAQAAIFADINNTLTNIDVRFDTYFNEHTLYEKGLVDQVVADLRDKGLVYEKEGATWFKSTEFGQDQDRVIIKSSGEPTYRLPDMVYHREKFRRGFEWMVNVFGADPIATVPDVLAGVRALGYDDTKIKVVLHQFVTLLREGRQVKMSTRKATFITVDELLAEVGADVLRFFNLMRKSDSQLEFDLDLAKKQSQENPVYYVQYAHARLCSIERQAREQGMVPPAPETVALELLREQEEYALLKLLGEMAR